MAQLTFHSQHERNRRGEDPPGHRARRRDISRVEISASPEEETGQSDRESSSIDNESPNNLNIHSQSTESIEQENVDTAAAYQQDNKFLPCTGNLISNSPPCGSRSATPTQHINESSSINSDSQSSESDENADIDDTAETRQADELASIHSGSPSTDSDENAGVDVAAETQVNELASIDSYSQSAESNGNSGADVVAVTPPNQQVNKSSSINYVSQSTESSKKAEIDATAETRQVDELTSIHSDSQSTGSDGNTGEDVAADTAETPQVDELASIHPYSQSTDSNGNAEAYVAATAENGQVNELALINSDSQSADSNENTGAYVTSATAETQQVNESFSINSGSQSTDSNGNARADAAAPPSPTLQAHELLIHSNTQSIGNLGADATPVPTRQLNELSSISAARSNGNGGTDDDDVVAAAAAAPTQQLNGVSSIHSNLGSSGSDENEATGTAAPTRQGAYRVTQARPDGYVTHSVTIPESCRPGSCFYTMIGNLRVSVECPQGSWPGDEVVVELPHEWVFHYTVLKPKPLTASPASEDAISKGIACTLGDAVEPMSLQVRQVNAKAIKRGCSVRSHLITIPENTTPGEKFEVSVDGKKYSVRCPSSASPGDSICIHLHEAKESCPLMQTFAVKIPKDVTPGNFFAFKVGEDSLHQVVVQCPRYAAPGRTIQVKCPTTKFVKRIRLSYPSHRRSGWVRTVRESDFRFQWMRFEQEPLNSDNVNNSSILFLTTFDFWKSAAVRKIIFLEGNSPNVRTGLVSFVPADQAVVDSKLVVNGKPLVLYADIAQQQGLSLAKKHEWFLDVCRKLAIASKYDFAGPGYHQDDYIKILVRREFLLKDSIRALFALGENELRRPWKISFVGEPAIDGGGPSKEWIQSVTEQLLDPKFGLFVSSTNNQGAVDINPCFGSKFSGNHLVYYRFAGRVLGRALFDGKEIKGHLVRTLYKHILAWPITYEDLEAQDAQFFQSMKQLTQMEDLSSLYQDFTVTHDCGGRMRQIDLVEDGSSKKVNCDNLAEYLEATFRFRLFDRILPQLTEFLLGFYDVVPEPLLTVFDASELDLLLCGLPHIDVEDWKKNTIYGGCFAARCHRHPVVQWFWDVVCNDFDNEMRARLLQFATGSSSVPSRGFAQLLGNDGEPKPFTINGVNVRMCFFPRAHTCFNCIDLPNYVSKEELKDRLIVSITTSCVGFDAE